MGGGTSRFEETDWDTATGKLTSPEDTVDGALPTSEYGVYFLTKQNYTQRDYDITDADSNLIYTTKSVEGTLAWFDLLGPRIDDYKLRVQVDIARRFWIIYSYGIPAYVGQFADMKATTQLRETRSETLPCLYKRACLTVTWSRYHAIVNRYGSPQTDEELEQETVNERKADTTTPMTSASTTPTTDGESEEGTTVDGAWTVVQSPNRKEDATYAASCDTTSSVEGNVSADSLIENFPHHHRSDDDTSCGGVEEYKEEIKTPESSPDRQRSKTLVQPPDDSNNTEETSVLRYADATGHVQESSSLDLDAAAEKANVPAVVLQQWKDWAANSIRGDLKDENDANPLEGVLQRDTPILKCEEINSFMGQHQTMLLSAEDVKRLKEEEAKAAASAEGEDSKDNSDNRKEQRQTQGGGAVADFSASMIAASNSMMGAARESVTGADGQTFPRVRRFAQWVSSRTLAVDPADDNENNVGSGRGLQRRFSMPEIGVIPKVEEDSASLQNGGYKRQESTTSASDSEKEVTMEKVDSGDTDKKAHDEPLVGYWIWDNTVKVHKMKMHVAAGADLALHVVLAVVTNQLRLERNVVLSTV